MSRSFVVACLLIVASAPVLAAGVEAVDAGSCPDDERREAAAEVAEPATSARPAAAASAERPRASSGFGSARRARWHSLLPGMYK